MDNLYRIERFISLPTLENHGNRDYRRPNENRHEDSMNMSFQLVLEKIPDDIYNREIQLDEFLILEFDNKIKLNSGGVMREGMFVYFNQENQTFSSARNDHRVKKLKQDITEFTEKIIGNSNIQEVAPDDIQWMDSADVDVTSYHVNVGHGNCTIILIQKGNKHQIWMVDCGIYDYRNKTYYNNNIEVAFDKIKHKIGTDNICIDRFYLTHWHYDHYSGLEYLIREKLIGSHTLFLMNLYNVVNSASAACILKSLNTLTIKCLEPISSNHTISHTTILYPDCRIVNKKISSSTCCIVENNVNNSSVVYLIEINRLSMIFTGDIEQKGIKKLYHNKNKINSLLSADYLCVPHHASINGNIFLPDLCNKHILICLKTWKYAIVMGRDGAYNGIYDHSVISWYQCHLPCRFCKCYCRPIPSCRCDEQYDDCVCPCVYREYPSVIFSEYDNLKRTHRGVELNWRTHRYTSI